MTSIPVSVARRIDRAAWRAHAFHRYAHHPLCAAYQGEVLRIGAFRVCKGCSFAALGGCLGGAVALWLPAIPIGILGAACALGMIGVLGLVALPGSRVLGKGCTRFLPALLSVFIGIQGLRSGGVVGGLLAAVPLGSVGIAVAWYRRRGPWRGPCLRCPERQWRPCSGFRLQLRRERAFQRFAGRMLAKASVGFHTRG